MCTTGKRQRNTHCYQICRKENLVFHTMEFGSVLLSSQIRAKCGLQLFFFLILNLFFLISEFKKIFSKISPKSKERKALTILVC